MQTVNQTEQQPVWNPYQIQPYKSFTQNSNFDTISSIADMRELFLAWSHFQ